MTHKINWLKGVFFLSVAIFGIVLFSCKNKQNTDNSIDEDEIVDDIVNDEVIESINEAKKIFYALPSPLETAILIKKSGATYNEELLNPVDNADNYTTNKSMALNLGIYITDLSFASLFDQTQTTITYMNTSKKLADRLGILDAIDNETIERLEENINNREVIMDIISETFMSSSSFLQENDRQAISSIMLIGGWVEGLYIATQLVEMADFEDNKLVDRIADQKLSYDIVVKLMEQNKENESVASLMDDVNALKGIFESIEINTSTVDPEVITENGTSVVKSASKTTITPEVFNKLSDKVVEIRTKFVK